MDKVGSVLLKAIYHDCYVKIEYKNKKDEITNYMIGIIDINPHNKLITCVSFNIVYSNETSERTIYFDSILKASLCEGTYHKTPEKLIKKIESNREEFIFLTPTNNSIDLINYFSLCYKLDGVPYIPNYEMIPGLDKNNLLVNERYILNEEQFAVLAQANFFQEERKKNKKNNFNNQLCCNVLSIKTKKGLYVLAYYNLLLDIENKCLIPTNDLIINKEFSYDVDTNDAKNIESIYRYLPEEEYYLLEEDVIDIKKIVEVIHDYNNTRYCSYIKEVKTEQRPFIFNLATKNIIDIDKELAGIKKMIEDRETMSMPIKILLGDNDTALSRRINYPIFTVDNKFNIDQINAINIGMKSPISYIQGPPGTGKTQTLLNAIVTAEFNGKTVLVASNNNIPMDGVYEDILNLKYKNIPLLFPVLRLGDYYNCDKAIDRILEMYDIALKLKPDENRITKLKEERKNDMKELVKLLSDYDKLTNFKTKETGLLKVLKENTNNMISIDIESQLDLVRKEIKILCDVEIDKFESLLKKDEKYFNNFFMSIHFETAARLKKLSKTKYSKLMSILKMEVIDDETRQTRVIEFRKYLSNDENLADFLEIFPIIISTNLSCTYLGSPKVQFDMVMIDEAGQCNIVNALIPIVRGKQLMLIGDPQQLKPVIVLDNSINKNLKNKLHIPKEYDYIKNSIYTLYTNLDIVNNETLLSYHYRCHNSIIEFSNKKYYHNRLKLKGNSQNETPLIFVDTNKDDINNNSNIRNISEVEAKYICDFIKANSEKNIGIITPFVHQKECIQYFLDQNGLKNISVGTVHAFQGDQKDIIVFSTAITNDTRKSTYDWIKNNKELINVAVSRAKEQFVMLANKEAIDKLSNNNDDLKELAEYIKTNGNSKVTDVSIESVALGTRQISSESEQDLNSTVKQILSVINKQCYIRNEVPISAVFNNDNVNSSLFYKQRFDLVIFERQYSGDKILLAIELNGPEHYTDSEVIARDKQKLEYCEKHGLKLYNIPRDCARDYYDIKETLMTFMKIKK